MDLPPLVLAPNAFKGTLSPLEAAKAMAAGVEMVFPGRKTLLRPLPDGGDGTLDVLASALGAERIDVPVSDACGRPRTVPFGLVVTRRRRIAIIESAHVIGLAHNADCPFAVRTTFGLGQLIRAALDCGARSFYIGLGGSATCDAGAGLLAALGLRFFMPPPSFATLGDIRVVDRGGLDPRLRQAQIVGLTDVSNGLLGRLGAALYMPQKGADRVEQEVACVRLAAAAQALEQAFGRRACESAGSGAAGGLGFALALLNGRLLPGALAVARLTGLAKAIRCGSLVITGEGACDGQTQYGKGPLVVATLARRLGKPTVLVCGRRDPSFEPLAAFFTQTVTLLPAPSPAFAVATAVARLLESGTW